MDKIGSPAKQCKPCPRATYAPEEGMTSCNVCNIQYHVGESTTAKLASIFKWECLPPLWNLLVLLLLPVCTAQYVAAVELKKDRDRREKEKKEKKEKAELEQRRAQEAEGGHGVDHGVDLHADNVEEGAEEEQTTSFLGMVKALASDLFLVFPFLLSVKVCVTRLNLMWDMLSDGWLIQVLWESEAGEFGVGGSVVVTGVEMVTGVKKEEECRGYSPRPICPITQPHPTHLSQTTNPKPSPSPFPSSSPSSS